VTNAVTLSSAAATGFLRNRIINGAMVIDQRNAGASVTPTVDGTYTLDRWKTSLTQSSKFSVQQQTSIVPEGFTYALKVTSLSAYSVGSGDTFSIYQVLEGFNIADFSWGTANAKSVTLSFRVYSSLTGTFGGAIVAPSFGFSYPFNYSVASANTWTTISVTVAGPTSGTFGSTNGNGFSVFFGLGSGATYSGTAGAWASSSALTATGAVSVVGTNGATFYITGVQLEVGTVATPFERRLYGTELMLCQRYYEKSYDSSVVPGSSSSNGYSSMVNTNTGSTLYVFNTDRFAAVKRASPTVRFWDLAGNLNRLTNYTLGGLSRSDNNNSAYSYTGYQTSAVMINTQAASFAATYQWDASAEL
jgi:hypothetical protein